MRHIMITSGYYDAQWRKYEAGGSLNLQSLLKIALTLEVPLNELFDGLGQWPALNVEEIEKRRAARLNLLTPDAEQMQILEAKQIPPEEPATKTRAYRSVVKGSSVLRKTPPSAKTRSAPASNLLPQRKPAK
ncbi:hypothetical protein [Granulicella arctica]|uniref:hypothetical protein n=1 Tax=Granulicella arctica TaxID=940613 RepID=UPI0021E05825|nr:hypothetical protein [Granulicella arctica]